MIATYLFFPLPTDEAITLRWTGHIPPAVYIANIKEDIESYAMLLQDEAYVSFCEHQYPNGLSLKNRALLMGTAINYGENEPKKTIFFDTLDIQNPNMLGQAGYGYFTVEIVPESERILYTVDGRVTVSCVIQDDSGIQSPLSCTISFPLYVKALEQLAKKGLPHPDTQNGA